VLCRKLIDCSTMTCVVSVQYNSATDAHGQIPSCKHTQRYYYACESRGKNEQTNGKKTTPEQASALWIAASDGRVAAVDMRVRIISVRAVVSLFLFPVRKSLRAWHSSPMSLHAVHTASTINRRRMEEQYNSHITPIITKGSHRPSINLSPSLTRGLST